MAIAENTKVFFKAGSQTSLNSLKNSSSIIPGTFYLTEDTNRLYIGESNNSLKLLNSTVNFIDSITSLNTLAGTWSTVDKANHINDIYYITGEANILAIWDGFNWRQINPNTDTKIAAVNVIGAKKSNDLIEITTATKDTEDTTNADAFQIEAKKTSDTGKNTVKVDLTTGTGGLDPKVIIEGDVYDLEAASYTDGASIKLNSNFENNSSINIIGDGNTTVIVDNGDIKISSENWIPDNNSLHYADGKLTLSLKDQNDNGAIVTLTENLGVQLNGQFINLGENLDVYTKAQVEDKFKNLNGLTYRGTVSARNAGLTTSYYLDSNNKIVDSSNAAVNVSIGDMFLIVATNGTVSIDDTGAITGDLLIATGTENNNGYLDTVTWTVVPSGDNAVIDSTYEFVVTAAENKVSLSGAKGEDRYDGGSLKLSAGKDINVTSVADGQKNLTTTIKHADITTTNTAAPSIGTQLVDGDSITLVSSITVDNGHATQIVNEKLVLPKYSITKFNGANANTETESKINLSSYLKGNDEDVLGTLSLQFKSNTLSLSTSASGDTAVVDVDIVWGTF